MLRCRLLGVWSGAVGFILMAGCSSTHPNPPAPHASWEPPPLHAKTKKVKEPVPVEVDPKIVDAYAHYVQGMIYDMDEKPEQAQEELTKSALADPSNADLILELTERLLRQKQPEKAIELLVPATAVPGASGALFARLGVAYSHAGMDGPAIDACLIAIKRAPDSLDGYRTLFFVHLQKGRPKEALKVLDQAQKVAGTGPEFVIELVELYSVLGTQAPSEKVAADVSALAALNRVAGQNPSNPNLRLKLADDYGRLGDTTNAARIYEQLSGTLDGFPAVRADVRDKLARLYLSQTNYAKASEELEAIIKDDPINAKAYYLLGNVAFEQRDFVRAAENFQKTVLLKEDFKEAYYDLAQAQINLNQPKEALATLAKAGAKFPTAFVSEVLAAEAYEREKDFTNAINHFTAAEVIGKATDNTRLTGGFYFSQGAAYERAGDYDQAERCFEKSLEMTPNFAEALNYFGYMLADRGVKLEKAHTLIAKAVELEPNSSAYLDSLAWVLYKLNRSAEALPPMQKAIKLSEEPEPTLFDHLGDIYSSLNQPEKAREAWTKSLSLEPNDQVRKKLGEGAGQTGQ